MNGLHFMDVSFHLLFTNSELAYTNTTLVSLTICMTVSLQKIALSQ